MWLSYAERDRQARKKRRIQGLISVTVLFIGYRIVHWLITGNP
jgi:hypothetical protein